MASAAARGGEPRPDAYQKASGQARYVADLTLPGMLHAAVVRSPVPHARITGVDPSAALALPGVAGVFTAADVSPRPYGRAVKDVPILAAGRVRFTGERVAAVVAGTRRAAAAAAALVEVTYQELPAVLTAAEAIRPGAPPVHDAPWDYRGAAVSPADGHNLQSWVVRGSAAEVSAALTRADHVIDRVYTTPSGHQGYLEPQACLAAAGPRQVRIWATNKSPYRLRAQLAECLGLDPGSVEVEPVPLGGDFGGKGSPMDIPLAAELSRLTGRPVQLVLGYGEDLTATNPRHPARIRVQAGCDRAGQLAALSVRALLNGGAYAGFKPLADASLHGIEDAVLGYGIPAVFTESLIAYTHTVPRGHMRSPGSPQANFAVESALDELAAVAGIDPVSFRHRNLARAGRPGCHKREWAQARGSQTLAAAVARAGQQPPAVPPGWRHGTGVAVYAREAPRIGATSVRLEAGPGGTVRVAVPIPETGTGSHAVVRNLLAAELGISAGRVEVVQVPTSELPADPGVGGSRVTVGMAAALIRAAQAWRERAGDEPVLAGTGMDEAAGTAGADGAPAVVSYCAQVATVAVDPGTGQVAVLGLTTAVDVGRIVSPLAHQMQIDGGAVMGYGFACLEDLAEEDGQLLAANLGEFKIPSAADVPPLRTVLVTGGQGVTRAGVKPVGELANVPVAAAVANAVAAATGCRIRDLPVTAEQVYWALRGEPPVTAEAQRP